ncbi:hypothetical protein K435DRAFT_962024 [Dendrothele bispora CBS 962.96]|uniref:GST N-terminal domain-containing protein n=1 Tax=Dendrothele bispora (strain CBS 962.96) TaxID=1314807 RepID=A0A4S8MMR6_DENBC|nr:hypothetical protein K435DRAFT_962024 [Dendrothele bispora CBS 962.96]
MPELKPIVFYDFPGKNESLNAWNPNCWKTRYCLNYKGVPYTTTWVEYPDVERILKAAGISPTLIKPDGSPLYTIPAIVDPNTGVALAESFQIAQYLDKTYPDGPTLVPAGTKALQNAFISAFSSNISPILQFSLLGIYEDILSPRSQPYFHETRPGFVLGGLTIEEAYPKGENAKEEWKKLEAGFGNIAKWMNEEEKFVMGDVISFADFAVAGSLQAARKIWDKDDNQKWKDISNWDGGRWLKLLENLEKYANVK